MIKGEKEANVALVDYLKTLSPELQSFYDNMFNEGVVYVNSIDRSKLKPLVTLGKKPSSEQDKS